MKIKTFYPAVFSTDPEATVKAMETFGFGIAHDVEAATQFKNEMFVLEDAEGHRVDVIGLKQAPRNFTGVRVNVFDFDEAYAELSAQGYKAYNSDMVESKMSRSALMMSPQGIPYIIIEHKK